MKSAPISADNRPDPASTPKNGKLAACPECAVALVHLGGCIQCRECGYSSCE